MSRHFEFVKARWFLFAIGIMLGTLVILGIRFVTYHPDDVHYHANFALYINGRHEQFKGPQYYEEETMCTISTAVTPMSRAHMHDGINDVVHIENHAVTWGQFFANLGWTLGPNFIASPDGTIYQESDTSKLHMLINGQDYTDLGGVASTVVKDQDRLLVSFGDESQTTLQQEYNAIPNTAHHYDVTPDPKSCGGHSGSSMLQDRMKHLF